MLYLRLMNDITLGASVTNVKQYWEEFSSTYRSITSAGQANRLELKDMLNEISVTNLAHKFPTCERNGVDQGVHNVLVHTNLIPFLKTFKQHDSPVVNMQGGMASVKLDGELMVVHNARGVKTAVAHQYDRNKELMEHLFQRVR